MLRLCYVRPWPCCQQKLLLILQQETQHPSAMILGNAWVVFPNFFGIGCDVEVLKETSFLRNIVAQIEENGLRIVVISLILAYLPGQMVHRILSPWVCRLDQVWSQWISTCQLQERWAILRQFYIYFDLILVELIIMSTEGNNIKYSMEDELNVAAPVDPYEEDPEIEEISEGKLELLIEEARNFHTSYTAFKKSQFFQHEFVYLVSSRWLKRWKKYVSYDEVISGKPHQKTIGCGRLPSINEDIIDLSQKITLKFEQASEKYLNTKLKADMTQGVNFQYLDLKSWKAIRENYQGYTLKRKIETSPDGKVVELYFQKIALVPMIMSILKDIEQERTTKLTEVTVQFSKYATVETFVHSVGKILRNWVEGEERVHIAYEDYLKLWIMPQKIRKPILLNTFLQGCKANPSFTYKLFIEGDQLDKTKQIRELDITKDTIIVAQMRQSRENWVFFNLQHKLKASCSYCKKQQELTHVCSCKYAVYCSKQCKSYDKTHHKYRCPNEAQSDEEEKELQQNQDSRNGLTGLRNLGNTCFMNSGLQCLSHIEPLTKFFISNQYLKEINKENKLGTHGELSTQYAKMIKNLWLGSESTFSPNHLKKSIGKYQPMFSGYNQHDSGELITYLLDGLHEDLNRVLQKPYTTINDYDGRPDAVIAKQAWETFLKRNQSIIVDLMYGQFKSKVECPNESCKNISITFDPFSVCTLPLIDHSKKKIELIYVKDYIYTKKIYLTFGMDKEYTLNEKMGELKQILGVAPQKRLIVYVSSYSSCDSIDPSETLSDIKRQYNYRSLYVRELNQNENPATDIKIMVANVVNNKYYSGETYRKNIAPYHLFFVNPNLTNKQVYFQIIGYFARITKQTIENQEDFYNKFINVLEKEEIFRILLIPVSRYYTCSYCSEKQCTGCKLPYNEELFSEYVKFNPKNEYQKEKKIDIELYWRQDEKEIEKIFDQIKEENQTTFSKGSSERAAPSSQANVSIYDCLKLFEKEETLAEDNAWYCPKCKDFVLAKKEMKIYKAPKILILCLKRFKRKDYFSEKISALVDFPIEGLDLTDYLVNEDLPEAYFKKESQMEIEGIRVLYDLIGISNHFGSTGGGHYTAYCKDPKSGDWYDFDDSSVTALRSPSDVVSESAYILFYKRRQ